VAVHELCHRFEEAVPGISGLERQFLDRRLGARRGRLSPAAERWRHRLHRDRLWRRVLGKRTGEPRLFSWYSAATYRGGSAHREVFSTAYQAMTFGHIDERSLTLGPDRQPDEEHRNLVLGILASA